MIYFIRDTATGHIKVGFTGTDPRKRLTYLQIGTPSKLDLIGVIDGEKADERALHAAMSEYRVAGEWFQPSPLLEFAMRSARTVAPPERKSCTRSFWNGFSAAEVSRLTGLTSVALCEIKKGKYRPSPEKAMIIQRATGVSAVRLLFGDLADEALAHHGCSRDEVRAA